MKRTQLYGIIVVLLLLIAGGIVWLLTIGEIKPEAEDVVEAYSPPATLEGSSNTTVTAYLETPIKEGANGN